VKVTLDNGTEIWKALALGLLLSSDRKVTVRTLCAAGRMLESLQGCTNADSDDLLKYCDLVATLVSTKDSYCLALLEVQGILVGPSKQSQTCVERKSLDSALMFTL
jgi:hypothetical protein